MTQVKTDAVHEGCGGEVKIETEPGVYGSTYHCEECDSVHPTEVRFPKHD